MSLGGPSSSVFVFNNNICYLLYYIWSLSLCFFDYVWSFAVRPSACCDSWHHVTAWYHPTDLHYLSDGNFNHLPATNHPYIDSTKRMPTWCVNDRASISGRACCSRTSRLIFMDQTPLLGAIGIGERFDCSWDEKAPALMALFLFIRFLCLHLLRCFWKTIGFSWATTSFLSLSPFLSPFLLFWGWAGWRLDETSHLWLIIRICRGLAKQKQKLK